MRLQTLESEKHHSQRFSCAHHLYCVVRSLLQGMTYTYQQHVRAASCGRPADLGSMNLAAVEATSELHMLVVYVVDEIFYSMLLPLRTFDSWSRLGEAWEGRCGENDTDGQLVATS